jgi:hypothetical protein
MVEIRCSDGEFARWMNVLVDTMAAMFPGCEEFFKGIDVIEFILPGETGKLAAYAKLFKDRADSCSDDHTSPDALKFYAALGDLVIGEWDTNTVSHEISNVNSSKITCRFHRIMDTDVKPWIAVQRIMRLLDFPTKRCDDPSCNCGGNGDAIDFQFFGVDSPGPIVAEWERRLSR